MDGHFLLRVSFMTRLVALVLLVGVFFNAPGLGVAVAPRITCAATLRPPRAENLQSSSEDDVLEKDLGEHSFTVNERRGRIRSVLRVGLGDLVCGREYRVTLTLVNTSDSPIFFDNTSFSNSCQEFSIAKRSIPPGAQATALMVIKVPDSSQKTFATAVGKLENDGKVVAWIELKGELKGNLHLAKRFLAIKTTDDGFATATIPFLFDDSFERFDVSIPPDSELAGLVDPAVTIDDSGQGKILLKPSENFFMVKTSVSGEVVLASDDGEITRILNVALHQPLKVEILPQYLVVMEEDDEGLVANAILRCNEEIQLDDVRYRVNGKGLEIKEQRLSGQVMRLKILFDEDTYSKQASGTIVWKLLVQGQRYEIEANWSRR